jgi:adenylyltransferase/sulfurtransferase
MRLSASELKRYDRQILIPNWGLEGQLKLKDSKVVVAGIGGLGSPSSLYLVAAGIGEVILVDKDKFELSNLNRQILSSQKDLGRFKAEIAKEKLEMLNTEVKVTGLVAEVSKENIGHLIGDADVVVDGMDNWKGRFIINEYCVSQDIPFVHAGVSSLNGQMITIVPGKGPCLRCIFPEAPPEIKRTPIFGATPAIFSSIQVMEVIKLLTGIGKPLVGRMLFLDGTDMSFETIEIKRSDNCPICSVR